MKKELLNPIKKDHILLVRNINYSTRLMISFPKSIEMPTSSEYNLLPLSLSVKTTIPLLDSGRSTIIVFTPGFLPVCTNAYSPLLNPLIIDQPNPNPF